MTVGCALALAFILSWSFVASFILDDGYRSAHTKYGEIVGHVEIVNFDGRNMPVSRYLGIPYAKPPVGDLRFRKPVPITTLTSPFAAHTYGHSCIQVDFGQPEKEKQTWSEDCLTLNVFAPSNAGQRGVPLKPVMIYIHGGGFLSGESKLYEGDVISGFADVITVTINYRLGPTGFFSTHDEHALGNYGLWDQNEAIMWVKDNIGAFGGAANNITLFGQSAGGACVFLQMMYPGSKGLFNQAIIESGALAPWAITTSSLSYNSSIAFAAALGCKNASKADMMQCIRSKSTSDVIKASVAIRNISIDIHPVWVPVYDGQFVVTEPSRMLQEAGDIANAQKFSAFEEINLLLGANSYDGVSLFSLFRDPNIFQTLTESVLKHKDIPTLLEFVIKHTPSTSTINAVIQEYVNGTRQNDLVNALINVLNDIVFYVPAARTAIDHATSKMSSTYLYQFSVNPPNSVMPLPTLLKNDTRAANHGDELLYVFGFGDTVAQTLFNVSGPISARDIAVSKFMMTTWTNFAKTGNPNSPVDVQHMFNVTWPLFTSTQHSYLDITDEMSRKSVKNGFAEHALRFWSKLLSDWTTL